MVREDVIMVSGKDWMLIESLKELLVKCKWNGNLEEVTKVLCQFCLQLRCHIHH